MRLTMEGHARRSVRGACLALMLVMPVIGVVLPGTAARGSPDVRGNEVVLSRGGASAGQVRSWSLGPDQPFLAVPFTGKAGPGSTIALGADVGVLLFEAPFFAGVDETCEYRLTGKGEIGGRWHWEKVTALPAPGTSGAMEVSLPAHGVGSLIVYRRALGPPPGALLLERRRYINWACEAPTKARGYKRLFVPMAAAPHRAGCFNMQTALSTGAGDRVELDFSAASEVLLLLPRDLDPAYTGVDHRLTVSLFDAAECDGASVSFALAPGAARHVALEAHDFDRTAESVMIRYEAGAFDPMLLPAGETPEAGETPVAGTAPADKPEADDPEADDTPAPGEPAEDVTAEAETATQAPSPAASIPEDPAVAETPTAGAESAEAPPAEDLSALEPAAADPAPPGPAMPAGGAEPARPEPEAAAPAAASGPSEPADTPRESAAAEPEGMERMAGDEAEADRIEPDEAATLAVIPAAEQPPPEEEAAPEAEAAPPAEEGQTGLLSAPEPPAESGPEPPEGAQTFKYPLLQGYRLSACLYGREACGEPAASEWCRARGFSRAADWTIDENIGSLFPTLAIGDLQLCASYVCNGFLEITCAP